MKYLHLFRKIFEYDKYIQKHQKESLMKQTIVAASLNAFVILLLSVVNIIEKSYFMLYFTGISFIILLVTMFIGVKTKNQKWIDYLSIILYTIVFSAFIILGGNDGFAALWVILIPCISMLLFDMTAGFISSCYFLLLLIVCFWTPINSLLPYAYTRTFLIRFPLLYFSSFLLSIYLTVIIKRTQYKLLIEKDSLFIEKNIDKMTNIFNRTKFEEDMQNVYPKCKTLGIILFDINFLKMTNDSLGHMYGDEMIIDTAKSIKISLNDNQSAYRIGGDEFVVIMPNCTKKDCFAYITTWKKNFDIINSNNKELYYSVAYGCGFGNVGFNIKDVLNEADNNMYTCKEKEESEDREKVANLIKNHKNN